MKRGEKSKEGIRFGELCAQSTRSLAALASLWDVSPQRLNNWKKRGVSAAHAAAVAATLGCDPAEISSEVVPTKAAQPTESSAELTDLQRTVLAVIKGLEPRQIGALIARAEAYHAANASATGTDNRDFRHLDEPITRHLPHAETDRRTKDIGGPGGVERRVNQ